MLLRPLLTATLVLSVFIALTQLHQPAYAQSPNELSGTVTNGTAGEGAPVNLQVTLQFQAESDEVIERVTLTEAGGAFNFVNLPPQGNLGYVVSATYLEVEYTNRRLGEPLVEPLGVTIYELTNDFTVLYLLDDTLALTSADKKTRQIEVLEAVKLRNNSDRTFQTDVQTDGPMNLLRFTLPAGATDLDVETSLPGGHILQVNLGFALTTPIPPGEHDILYVYRAPYDGSSLEYEPHFPMGVESYRVMLPDGLARAESMGMQLADSATIGDRTFVMLESENVEVGGRVNFTMTGLPQPSLMQRAEKVAKSDGFQRGVLPGLAGLVFVGLVGFTLVRRRRASVAGEDGFEGVDDEHDDLILAIATLDERFESGDIEEEAYNQQRAELLEQIRNNSG
jgi:hypothetical protein